MVKGGSQTNVSFEQTTGSSIIHVELCLRHDPISILLSSLAGDETLVLQIVRIEVDR